ncbi:MULTISPECIES: HTH domain-containing protein [Klebsiella pneumoniae complex]|jgi:hypothetical protein|uniref:HTH domain-containing protein n=1 Tax=Klebsiella pneumoniae complex TaxID=3390273 RepID=UPI001257ABA1|nr:MULTISPECIES: HTH domain-containing protein [Klebsiella]HDU6078469.1 HTH domain-containing protein [Klebsiella pneumoniae subsp. pneumoniae]MBF7748568.1 HTH domain-containing protein [Klebsiella pneumoniae]MBF7753815.1 HTH domain-containing protein [Klebsiella quasipneumoniae]MBF7796368.1 HTH domain-containing protein [Klebsiella pneumoniae]MBF7801535.1 HTH domain-containing protein [Klebsiella pneumoniae]
MSEHQKTQQHLRKIKFFADFIKDNQKSTDDNVELLTAKNSRWEVTLFLRVGPKRSGNTAGGTILVDDWKKPSTTLTKDERHLLLREFDATGLITVLTQELLAKMLDVSSSTIQKDLAELNEKKLSL